MAQLGDYSKAVFLINDDVRAIAVTYEPEVHGKKVEAVIFKSMDKSLRKDDYVVVPTSTRHLMTVVKIIDVDVDVDLTSSTKMDWIIGRVERSDYESISALEQHAIEQIKSAEKRQMRDEMRNSIFKNHEAMLKEIGLTKLEKTEELPPATPLS